MLRVAAVDSLLNGVLIGAGIGAAPALLAAAAYCNDYCDESAAALVVVSGAGIGAGIGILADYGREKEGTVLFEAPATPRPIEFTLSPIVSRERKGAMFVTTW